MTKPVNPALIVIAALGGYLLLTSAFYPIESLSVFDAKRMTQLVLFVGVLIFTVSWAPLRAATVAQLGRLSLFNGSLLALFFLIGIVSSLRLEHPSYALLDVSMLFVMLVIIAVVAGSRELSGLSFDKWGVVLLATVGLAVALQEMMGFAANWMLGSEFSYTEALMHFAHPRFYNQLQTWTIPVLAALPLLFPGKLWIKLACIFLLGLQWFLVIAYAARGTAVSLTIAMIFIAFWCQCQRKTWLSYQFAGVLAGIVIFFGVLQLNSLLIPQSGTGEFYAHSVGRPMLHTTGRTLLWRLSIEDAIDYPYLGSGPTRYACDSLPMLPAHPHSFPLRIMGEWGVVAFILMLGIVATIGLTFLKSLNQQQNSRQTNPPLTVMLAISLIAGVIHSCVSGLLIMPASQVGAILISGWILGLLCRPQQHPNTRFIPKVFLFTGVVTCCLLITFAIKEVPNLGERTGYFENDKLLGPRFWQDGRVCDYRYDQ